MRDHGDEPILELIISRNIVTSILKGSSKLISTQFRERAGLMSFIIRHFIVRMKYLEELLIIIFQKKR